MINHCQPLFWLKTRWLVKKEEGEKGEKVVLGGAGGLGQEGRVDRSPIHCFTSEIAKNI